jgi:NTE family protein
LTAQTPQEIAFDKMCVDQVRLVEHGRLPSWAVSPSSRQFQAWTKAAAAMIGRPEFTDLRALLLKHVDFGALTELVRTDSPALLIGAADVLEGSFKVFSSVNHEISVDAVLASAAIPTLFPAVWVDGHAYWDGIFSSNPPVSAFLRKQFMGTSPRPEEIWIIQVNPSHYSFVPEAPSDVYDRRNHLAGNVCLQHELEFIELINMLIRENALPDDVRARFSLDITEPVVVRYIRMSDELQKSLDYASKLSRQPAHIANLIAHGQQRARSFLAELGGAERPFEAAPGQMPVQIQ